MKVRYLTGPLMAISSVAPALCEQFGKSNVSPIKKDELTYAHLKDVNCLMLPGITGESSPYPNIIRPEKEGRMLYNMMEDGMTVILECASFYWGAEEIAYLRSDGEELHRNGLGWVKGIARGPSGKGLASDKNFRYADTTTTGIEFYDGTHIIYTPICISNGPALYLSELEQLNLDVKITSRFIEEPGRPVASMTKQIGNGLLVGLGVLPHIKTMQLGGRMKNPGHESHRVELFNTVAANEPQIARFETIVYDQIKAHHAARTETPYARFA